MKRKILITGAAGFIGFHLSERFLSKDFYVIGIDNLSGHYPKSVYQDTLNLLEKHKKFYFQNINVLNEKEMFLLINKQKPDFLIHSAAKTGVQKSITNPLIYTKTNILGTQILLEALRLYSPKTKTILLSSSSVYGKQDNLPLTEKMTPHPISPYGFSKYCMELIAKQYHNLYKIPIVIIRPFSIYGPSGRLDMAPFLVIEAAENEKPFIKYGNNENNQRDWTYIDDFVDEITKIVENYPFRSFEIFNFGNGRPVGVDQFVSITKRLIKKYLNKNLKIIQKTMRDFEMRSNYASIKKAKKVLKYIPKIDFKEGFERFLQYYVQNRRHRFSKL